MKNFTLFFVCLCGILVLSSCSDDELFQEQEIEINVDPKYHVELNKDTLLSLVNIARTSGYTCQGIYHPPVEKLEWNNKLEEAARLNSDYMFQFGVQTHTWSDGTDAGDLLTSLGYKWHWFGDNGAHGNLTEITVIQGWLDSPGHCRNIMNGNFKVMGIAQTENFWTMVLAD